ncbi:hypothetical protein HRD49_16580, partial [Corallococcus exiguus]|nr:hypothetical protein [Corallococcus exiguus]
MSRSAFVLSVLLALESVPALAQEPAPRTGTTKASRGTKKKPTASKATGKTSGTAKVSGTGSSKRRRKPTAAEATPAPSDAPLSESLP